MKVGMMPVWDKWGTRYATTVLQLDDCRVVQVKTNETDGYTAVQLGVGEAKANRVKGTMAGHMAKWGDLKGKRKLGEFRVTPDCLLTPGTQIPALHFVPGQLVDVCGISKGKGFQGVMKRWNFRGGDATHGNSISHRTMGSTGMCQDPGRVFKNKKMPGRMGAARITTQNLFVVRVDTDRNLVYVNGNVPGQNGTFLCCP
jgi:large subunit ribosomal protein L3